MRRGRERGLIGALAILFLASSCGEDTASVSVNLSFTSGVEAQVLGSGVTARVWYRSNRTGTETRYQPAQTIPQKVTTTVENTQQTVYYHQTASHPGFSFGSGSTVTLRNLPLNQAGVEIAIEFLKTVGGASYVFAYAVYKGPTDQGLTKARLQSDFSNPLFVYFGRTCGTCATQQLLTTMPTDTQLAMNCDASGLPYTTPSNACAL